MIIGKRTFTIVACLIGYASMQDSSAAASDLASNVESAVSRQDFTTATDLLDDHLVEYPDDNAARFKRAQVLGWAGNYTKARSEFDSLVAESPGNVDYVFGRARILARQGHAAEALQEVGRARQLAPDYEAIWQLQFQLLAQQENETADQELTALRPEAEQRFPQANWLQASRHESASDWRVLIGLNVESLSDDLPGWNQEFLEVMTNRSNGARYFLRAARHERFGNSDSTIGGGGDWQLAGEWFAGMNAQISPSAEFQPDYEVGGPSVAPCSTIGSPICNIADDTTILPLSIHMSRPQSTISAASAQPIRWVCRICTAPRIQWVTPSRSIGTKVTIRVSVFRSTEAMKLKPLASARFSSPAYTASPSPVGTH